MLMGTQKAETRNQSPALLSHLSLLLNSIEERERPENGLLLNSIEERERPENGLLLNSIEERERPENGSYQSHMH